MKPKTQKRRYMLDRRERRQVRQSAYVRFAKRTERRAERRHAACFIQEGISEFGVIVAEQHAPTASYVAGILMLFLALAKKSKAESMASAERYFASFWGGAQPSWQDMLFLAEDELGLS